MNTPHPVEVEVRSPATFDRMQLLVRLAILVAAGVLGVSLGWLFTAAYLLLPVVAAIGVASRAPGQAADVRPALRAVLTWLVGFYAYMVLLVDELPLGTEGGAVHLSIRESGRPTVASTLMRWLTSLPSALVLGVLAIVSGLFAFLGAISILASATQPASVLRLQRAVIVWQARLLAYHASLVEEYPPFHLDVGTDQAGPIATQP